MPSTRVDRSREWRLALLLLSTAVLAHRILQLYLLWEPLSHQIDLNAHAQIMQLLPRDLWRQAFYPAILYLQQAPPIPNLVYGLVVCLLQSPQAIAAALILLNGLIAALTASLMAGLLVRLGINRWLGLALAAIFAFSADLLLIEYQTWGHFFYETSSMLLCVVMSHAALSLARRPGSRAALWLGLWVALLALTRATYSYLFLAVIAWLMLSQPTRRPAIIACFLLPVLLLQGGWAGKNYLVHGYWSLSTSSWGGSNAHTGDAMRHGRQEQFNQWVLQNEAVCTQPWQGMLTRLPTYIFFIHTFDPAEHFALPRRVLDHDNRVDEQRGQRVAYDTLAIRELSSCLQKAYLRYWLANPAKVIGWSWQSYQLFWLPVRQFNVRHPNPLRPVMPVFTPQLYPGETLQAAWEERRGGRYQMLQRELGFTKIQPNEVVAVPLLVLPVFPLVIHAVNVLCLHGLPVLAAILYWQRKKPGALSWPKGFGFLVLLYLYLAALCNLVEYGENMRFRLEVEPVIWAISAVCLRLAWLQARKVWRPPDTSPA